MTKERSPQQWDYNVKASSRVCEETESLTERLLESYVSGMQNVDELVKSDHPADIAKVKLLIKLLQLKNNNGTITENEIVFFRRLFVAVKLEESIDNAPVWQILKEDLLYLKIEKIKKRVRGFIARRTN